MRHQTFNSLRVRLAVSSALAALVAAPQSIAQVPAAMPDPPARVGRIARLSGTVSFRSQDGEQWLAATRNYPLVIGDALWTEPGATATVDLGGAHLGLAQATEVILDRMDPGAVAATEAQGEVCLIVEPAPESQTYSIRTPRGTVTIKQPGRYGISAGDTAAPTAVTVLAGAAEIGGDHGSVQVAVNQAATVTGSETFETQVGAARPDHFLSTACTAPAARPSAVAPPPATQLMVGTSDLEAYGTWQSSPQYGAVWYPQVEPGWVPYRNGHWAYVAPWGWTWIDDAPWGFAPFHYGRWADIGGRWAWVPVAEPIERPQFPVYAPALVSFVAAAALAGGSVAWLPLGPREVYRPWYHASEAYVRDINVRQVRSITNVDQTNTTVINNYDNRRAATVVSASVMAASRPVAAVARPLSTAALASAHPLVGRVPVQPTAATSGVTAALATRMNSPAPTSPHPTAPGPERHGFALGASVPLHPALNGAPARPRLPAVSPAVAAPGTLPVLPAPGERHEIPRAPVASQRGDLLSPHEAAPSPSANRPGQAGRAPNEPLQTPARPEQSRRAEPPRPPAQSHTTSQQEPQARVGQQLPHAPPHEAPANRPVTAPPARPLPPRAEPPRPASVAHSVEPHSAAEPRPAGNREPLPHPRAEEPHNPRPRPEGQQNRQP